MKKLAENLALVLLICLGVRVGAALVEPVLPLLGGIVVIVALLLWLFGHNGPGGGYR
jgi:hypothetical protein